MDLLDGITERDLQPLLHVSPPGSFDPARITGSAYWSRVAAEVRTFVCTDSPEYADLRREWADLKKEAVAVAVGALTAAISSQLGAAAAIVAPLVAWALLLALKIGTRAYCAAYSE